MVCRASCPDNTNDNPIDKLITSVVTPEEALSAMQWWSQNPGSVFRILVAINSGE